MFKRKESKNLIEAPLAYWEESSYMLVVPRHATEELLNGIIDRVSDLSEIEVKESSALTDEQPGRILLVYEDEEYEVRFYPSGFSVPEYYLHRNYYFSEKEKIELMSSKAALTMYMPFHHDAKKSYHLQLKLAVAMIPDMLGVMDESAEKMLPAQWVRMAASSKVLPSANDLYSVQAVSGDKGEVWLHTHGLCRCGLTELEILDSDQDNYNNHYNLISTFASYLLDKKEDCHDSCYIGILANGQPVVATYLSWTKGLCEYKKLNLGNVKDREGGHNSRTSIIFLYKSEEDEEQGILTKVSEFNDLWGNNPLFFISDSETARMKALAMERFHYVKKVFEEKKYKVTIKIGLPVDNHHRFEHIWFELLKFEGDTFTAKLLQEPYDIQDIQVGDERSFTVDDVTDWIIYAQSFTIQPGNAYLLNYNF